MDMKSLLQKNKSNIALVVGNGINRYGSARQTNSWQGLLVELSTKHLPSQLRNIPIGLSLTEFYDILELRFSKLDTKQSLQKDFCDLMSSWQYFSHHKRIVEWAKSANAPILTTNFERVLADAGGCALHRTRKGGFTDYYPWENYYGTKEIADTSQEFAIWHMNGMQHYHRSVRLGLSHYMGSVERARGWLHKGNEKRLFSGKNIHGWDGADTWLHVVFNTPLLIFGLGLEENEVFIRWLLIERARYFKKFPDRRKDAWYVQVGETENEGKIYFLEGVGVHILNVDNYDHIYGPETWS